MKKILSLTLAILLALSIVGCGKADSVSKDNMQFGKTSWGMTLAETCKALNINQDVLKKVDGTNAYEYADYKYEGITTLLVLQFTSGDDNHGKLYHENLLSSVYLYVENKEQLDKVIDNFKKSLGEPNDKSSDERALTWNSATNVADNFKDADTYEKYLIKYETAMYADLDRSEAEITKRINALKVTFDETPLEKISTTSLDDLDKYYITYNGIATCYANL